MSHGLTSTQSEVLDFIALHVVQKQRPPTRHDIAQRFGWASGNAADTHIQALERKGYISLEASARGSHWQRYPRVIRWPSSVLPVIQLSAPTPETAQGA